MPAEAASSLSAIWNDYERSLLDPINASQSQRVETRRAFYAGAQAFYGLLMHGMTEGPEVDEPSLERIASLDRELAAFTDKIRLGLV